MVSTPAAINRWRLPLPEHWLRAGPCSECPVDSWSSHTQPSQPYSPSASFGERRLLGFTQPSRYTGKKCVRHHMTHWREAKNLLSPLKEFMIHGTNKLKSERKSSWVGAASSTVWADTEELILKVRGGFFHRRSGTEVKPSVLRILLRRKKKAKKPFQSKVKAIPNNHGSGQRSKCRNTRWWEMKLQVTVMQMAQVSMTS